MGLEVFVVADVCFYVCPGMSALSCDAKVEVTS